MASELEERILHDIEDHFNELDDTEDAPFGEYATINRQGNVLRNVLIIEHESNPDIRLKITFEQQ